MEDDLRRTLHAAYSALRHFYIELRKNTLWGGGGGYDDVDVDEEMDVSEASKLSA